MECSFCKKEIKEKLGFKNVFSKKESFILCESCKKVLNINIEQLGEYTLYYFADYEFLKDSIYAIKYGGDVEECLKYKSLFRKFFEEYNFDLITIVPANNERKVILSFDHIEQLCTLCNVKFEKIHPFQDGNGRVGRLIMFKECLKYNIVPFIIEDDLKMFYYRGLTEWEAEKGYLRDTCLTAQDRYKAYLDYFRIGY